MRSRPEAFRASSSTDSLRESRRFHLAPHNDELGIITEVHRFARYEYAHARRNAQHDWATARSTEQSTDSSTVKQAQVLARHSTPVLTLAVYSHVEVHELSKALEKLPATVSDATRRPPNLAEATA